MRFQTSMMLHVIAAGAYPFILFLPTKVAGSWFPDTQPAIATTIESSYYQVFDPRPLAEHLHTSLASMPNATFGVKKSELKLPPTFSAIKPRMDFVSGFKFVDR
ncbi:unnamed protein product [Caenorhabditis brenneri]